MSKHLEILEDLRKLNIETLASLVGALTTAAEDVALRRKIYDVTRTNRLFKLHI